MTEENNEIPKFHYHDMTENIAGTDSHSGKSSRDDDNSGYVIHFVHIPTNETCHFKAFITAFDDQYESQWSEQEVFGRMDPISTFKRTRRRIRLGWDIPAASEEEAVLNLREAEKLLNMLYPVFEERTAANFLEGGALGPITTAIKQRMVGTMVAPPLFKIKFANLIMNSNTGTITSGAHDSGLVGTIAGLNYRPDIEQGFFSSGLTGKITPGALIPQTISFDIDFVVHHNHGLGFRRDRADAEGPPRPNGDDYLTSPRAGDAFPYGAKSILK